MDAPEKLKKAYTINVHRLGMTNFYDVEFLPRGLQQLRGAGGESQSVPPGFVATVELFKNEPGVRWTRPPHDPDITLEEFNAEAVTLALERHREAAA